MDRNYSALDLSVLFPSMNQSVLVHCCLLCTFPQTYEQFENTFQHRHRHVSAIGKAQAYTSAFTWRCLYRLNQEEVRAQMKQALEGLELTHWGEVSCFIKTDHDIFILCLMHRFSKPSHGSRQCKLFMNKMSRLELTDRRLSLLSQAS